MPTRKQRRRRQKERRHEYEVVYVDEEGQEVEPPEEDDAPARRPEKRAAAKRAPRTVQPPSWRRVGKRALIFAPLMFVMISILEPDLPIAAKVGNALFLVLLFLPFSYLVDVMTYRVWRKRMEREGAET